MRAIEITNKIMKLNFSKSDAGILSQSVYMSLKYKEPKFIELGCKMFKDKRHNKWGDESGLITELRSLFQI